jgi:hypothetical protein
MPRTTSFPICCAMRERRTSLTWPASESSGGGAGGRSCRGAGGLTSALLALAVALHARGQDLLRALAVDALGVAERQRRGPDDGRALLRRERVHA